ncbi:MAG: glycosyl hydrolase [candidate division WOR-3 bacterium]|nr:glycosyl hydrolase [candidate division WOR-3 bacterium]
MSRQLLYPDSRPWTRWLWFNVELREEDITGQLDWVKANGFGGVELAFIYPLPGQKRGPDFLSPERSQKVAFAKRYCDTLGLGCDFTFGTLWPLGGTFVPEEDASQRFDGPSPQRLGRSWELPAEGRILNHLDREAFRRYAEVMSAGLAEALGNPQITPITQIISGHESAKSVESVDALRSSLFCDSFEVETEGLWTSGFDKVFTERFGYDVREYMPKLDEHPDVRYDYRKLIADYVLHEFYEPFTEFSHRVNSFSRVQCHGAPVDLLAAYAAADVPESEAILFDPEYARIPASAAALSGKLVVSAETFTCLYGWAPYPGPGPHQGEEQVADLKLLADALFANGVNHIFWHGMPYQPKAASLKPQAGEKRNRFYASVHVGPDSALAAELPAFNGYMEKVCAAMKLGRPYSDVAVYLPIEDQWMKGELPKEQQKPSARYYWELHYLMPPAELFGRQPLWVSAPFLGQARFEDGALSVGDVMFGLLYVDCEWLDGDGLVQVSRLAKAGLPVCLKRIPKRPGRAVDKRTAKEYQRTLEELTRLNNVSSDLGSLSQEPPLVSGRDVPDFWCRVVDDELLFFFGHPASRGLTYPMMYGQAALAGSVRRDVRFNLGGSASAFELPLQFEPRQSLLLHVTKTGRVEQLDIGYVPPELDSRGDGASH